MQAIAHIDLAALRHNFDLVKKLSPHTKVLAVIKAGGYGHGIARVARALSDADGFAVTNVEEAVTLRESGISRRIVALEGFSSPEELSILRQHGIGAVVHHESQVELLEQGTSEPMISAWLKVDTGMHRLGISPARLGGIRGRLRHCANVASSLTLMSHLANADDWRNIDAQVQIRNFLSMTADFGTEISIANSAAILAWPEARVGWIRPGIMLYGISPFAIGKTGADLGFLPAMTLSTHLIAVNRIPRGQTVGYGGSWTCPEDMPVGVAAIGYGDGYPRHVPSGCPVLVNGRRVPLIGRVSMDMITLDLRTQPDARIGDRVVAWGRGLPVEEIARQSETIAYELVCGVTRRVELVTKGS